MLKYIATFLFLFYIGFANAQKIDTAFFMQHIRQGNVYQYKSQADSALFFYNKAFTWSKQHTYFDSSFYVTDLLSGMGRCYRLVEQPQQSQIFLELALANAQNYKHNNAIGLIFRRFAALHQTIAEKNWAFNYPTITETETAEAYFSIKKIEPWGNDSLALTIYAGKLDGLVNDSQTVRISTRAIKDDTLNHKTVHSITQATIYRVNNNSTIILIAKKSVPDLLVEDFLVCNVEIPVGWNKLQLKSFLVDNVTFTEVKDPYYNYRFFYYYGSPKIEQELVDEMLRNANKSGKLIAKDTLTNSSLAYKYDNGIFTGYNFCSSLIFSQAIHLQLFFKYLQNLPANAMGNKPGFIDEYCAWIAFGSILYPSSIKPYLLSINNTTEKAIQLKNLYVQIKKNVLIDFWIGESLQQINDENYDAAKTTATLINDVVTINNVNEYIGWAEYILANVENRNGDTTKAKQYLNKAKQLFELYNNYEGKAWVNATTENWLTQKEISISVQAGHSNFYITALSPNTKYFATGGDDYVIKIWNKNLGKELKTLYYHKGRIVSLQYSANGRYLVSVGEDKKLVIWNTYNYTPIQSYTLDGVCNVAKFSPDSKLLYATEDSVLNIINPFTDSLALVKKIVLHKNIINDFVFYRADNNIIFSCADNEVLTKWDLSKEKILGTFSSITNAKNIQISNDNRYIATVSNDSILKVTDLFLSTYVTKIKVYVSAKFQSSPYPAMYAIHSFSPNSNYLIYPSTQDDFSILNLFSITSRSYESTKESNYVNRALFYNSDNEILEISSGYSINIMTAKNYDFYKNYKINVTNKINFYSNKILNLQYNKTSDSVFFYQFGKSLGNLSLATGKSYVNTSLKVNFPKTKKFVLAGDSLAVFMAYEKSSAVFVFNNRTNEISDTLNIGNNENIEYFESNNNNTFFYVSGEGGTILAWDAVKHKQQFKIKVPTDTTIKTMYLFFDAYRNKLFSKINANTVISVDALTGKIIDTILINKVRYIACTPQKIFMGTGDGNLYYYDANTLKYISGWIANSTGEDVLKIEPTPDNKFLVLQSKTTNISLYNIEANSFVYTIQDHQFGSESLSISKDGKSFITGGYDGKINVRETLTGKLKGTIYVPYKKPSFIVDTLQHYFAEKSSLDVLNINYNEQVYPYEQFDLQLNRPDIVLQNLGIVDTAVIKNYRNAFKKRIKKLGISETNITTNLHLPTIRLVDKYTIETTTNLSKYTLKVECKDAKYNLQSVQVLVNNSPILGINGNNIASLKTNSYTQQISVPLALGKNQIKVFCTNSEGVTSLKENFTIYSSFKDSTQKSKTYFIGIGVAKYKDSTYNLTYSAKDIRDLAADFSKYYDNAVIDTLLNQNVTIENIRKIKQKLLKTNPNDRVVIAVTGHGLLSDSLDFYYATYDVNFTKPEKRGLKYELLEDLLTDVPAQEKIMFIDACHSGALDKEELLSIEKNKKKNIEMNTTKKPGVTGIASRSTITIKNKAKKVNANTSFELMQNTFSDLGSSNGAIIVSAAGGMEYAFESAEWNNGVFTYCIRQGLFSKYADKYWDGNKNEQVSVEELIAYVNKQVAYLTKDKQKPNARKENLDFNWIIMY
jgi:WD40 repeat protein